MSTKSHPKSVHEKSPFDNVHEKSPILKKSVHEMSLSTKCLHPVIFNLEIIRYANSWKLAKTTNNQYRHKGWNEKWPTHVCVNLLVDMEENKLFVFYRLAYRKSWSIIIIDLI